MYPNPVPTQRVSRLYRHGMLTVAECRAGVQGLVGIYPGARIVTCGAHLDGVARHSGDALDEDVVRPEPEGPLLVPVDLRGLEDDNVPDKRRTAAIGDLLRDEAIPHVKGGVHG